MIEHLVFLKLNDEGSNIDKVISALVALKGKVPAIEEISCGRNFSDRSKGFNVGLRVVVKNEAAIDEYRLHPLHVDVLNNIIKPVLEDMIVCDYTVKS
jgi:hypothetical protein